MSYTYKYKGIVKDKVIVLEEGNRLPEGTKVVIIPQSESESSIQNQNREEILKRCWEITNSILERRGMLTDSVELVRQLRDERASR